MGAFFFGERRRLHGFTYCDLDALPKARGRSREKKDQRLIERTQNTGATKHAPARHDILVDGPPFSALQPQSLLVVGLLSFPTIAEQRWKGKEPCRVLESWSASTNGGVGVEQKPHRPHEQ